MVSGLGIPLFISVFAVATCGLIYELIAGTVASYLLGDSVTQFSTVIGVYLFAMGIGSYLTRYIRQNLLQFFVRTEILVGLVGGFSAAILYFSFQYVSNFRIVLYSLITLIGILVGVEIPLILRIMKDRVEFKDLVSRVFALDCVGALFASIVFPLVLVPILGLVRSSFLFGIINVALALWLLVIIRDEFPWRRFLQSGAIAALIALSTGFVYSEQLTSFAETANYQDNVIYAKSSKVQRIVLTGSEHAVKLHLNGNLQFNSRDEYRYHEALVHVGLATLDRPKRGLILGGGDGLALREVFKYPSVESVTLVDLDKVVTDLFAGQTLLTQLNSGSLTDPRVQIVNTDAFIWLRDAPPASFDFIIVDFPDPTNFSVGKLYTTNFYNALHRALAVGGVAVVQASSPIQARKSFWCVVSTLESVGFEVVPYHAYVPSFGEWGFVIASKHNWHPATSYPAGLRFVEPDSVAAMLSFPADMSRVPADINRLTNQALVRYFDAEWQDVAF